MAEIGSLISVLMHGHMSHDITNLTKYEYSQSKDSEQPGHSPSQIRDFAVSSKGN